MTTPGSGTAWERINRPRRRPSARTALVAITLLCAATVGYVGHDAWTEGAAYRNGSAPALAGTVISEPQPGHTTCGRGGDGYRVEVGWTSNGTPHTAWLATCRPSSLRTNTGVTVWERRPGELTLSPPSRTAHVQEAFGGGAVLVWLLAVAALWPRIRRDRVARTNPR